MTTLEKQLSKGLNHRQKVQNLEESLLSILRAAQLGTFWISWTYCSPFNPLCSLLSHHHAAAVRTVATNLQFYHIWPKKCRQENPALNTLLRTFVLHQF
jgi:hypothetical protein